MRRTYRSKKETGGALDHRDVLQNVDEKSSVFDAFYIQNIKQTKRDLSYVASSNHNGVASNKVRKRKYVKRIIKDIELVRQRETMSPSAYLTPDKSIRVNKPLDPFDMLLKSSPAMQTKTSAAKEDTFDKLVPKRENKTYTRKKLPRVKKFNYSSSDDSNSTEANKENTFDDKLNTTDIRSHELLVEREPSHRPRNHDESINKIVNNLSLINNFKRKSSNGSFNTSYKCYKNRLTKNLSPILQKSPLCSTPFKDKYRGVSIFKFSPISQKDLEVSPNCMTILEEKDNSDHSTAFNSNNVDPKEFQESPLAHVPNLSLKYKSDLVFNESKDSSSDVLPQSEIEHIDVEIQNEYTSMSNIDQSSSQITQAEPFLGFSSNDHELTAKKICLLKCLNENNSFQDSKEYCIGIELKNNVEDSENTPNSSIDSNKCNTSQSSLDSQESDKESLYDTCNSEQNSTTDDQENNREPVVAIERMSDSIFMKYYEKMQVETRDEESSDQAENEDFESMANDSNEEMFTNSLSTELDCLEAKANAIVITDSSTTEDVLSSNDEDAGSNNEEEICSFVTTRRRNEVANDSMFIFDNSYGSSSTDCDKTVLSNIKVTLEKPSVNIILNTSKSNTDADFNDEVCIRNVSTDLKPADNSACERISRITTRRSTKLLRQSISPVNEVENIEYLESPCQKKLSRITIRKSSKLIRGNNSTSPKSECSENEITLIDTNEINDEMVIASNKLLPEIVEKAQTQTDMISESSWIDQSGMLKHPERSSYAGVEVKPVIVLQPGKKWERSLSIYKRMTMVTDHFDQSLLEEECLQKKGRNYRQSVISTMEMQDCRDSLHNDSINSRRSTFISKPTRPTIRFVIDPNISRVSLNTSSVFDDLKGFLNEECDDTVVELSKLSIADSEHEVTILDNFHETERVATARDYVLRRCNQTEPILFDECYPETVLKNCHKIGEGVYGEVFLWRGRDGRARVMKIVPIAGNIKVNGEDQKDFHEIISEIVIAMELSALRAPIADIERQLDEGNDIHALELHAIENATDIFNEVLAVRCVYGAYPSRLLDLWELYDECRGSENDSPAALPADQRYIVLELANAGQDLESYQFASAQQAHALFQQIAFGLAVGEEAFQFEHRDLHWGNVLIAPTEQKLATFVLRGRTFRVSRCGVAATVIDYSLSRLSLPLAAESAALYNDLAADEQLFDAVGDYQFEVYRLMRDKLGNDWKNFEPYTNILWLHYTVDKMITALRYKRTNTKIHKHYIEKLKGIKGRILEYGSAVQYVLTDIDI